MSPSQASPSSSSGPSNFSPAVRSSVVWDDLSSAVGELVVTRGRPLEVVDVGGGTGGFAVPLAQLGHRVVVVDPSPDSLASLERRAAEAGVGDLVSARQGDVDTLGDAIDAEQADVLLCHDVLEVADDPGVGIAAMAVALQPGGLLSLLAANRSAAVLGRVLAGRLEAAEAVLMGAAPAGADRTQQRQLDRRLDRRFDVDELTTLVEGAGMAVLSVHGDRIFTDLVPGAVLDAPPQDREVLRRIEQTVARLADYRAMATRLHLLAAKS